MNPLLTVLFYYGQADYDGYHCGKLIELGARVSTDYLKNAFRKETVYKNTDVVIYDEFYPKLSKPTIDEIDKILAEHYGFTAEELDFIINYDIKYHMGKEFDNGEDE